MRYRFRHFISRGFVRSFSVLIGIGMARQALAISIVDDLPSKEPNQFQSDLIKNPQKQRLIAEIADCVGYPPYPNPWKLKCLMGAQT